MPDEKKQIFVSSNPTQTSTTIKNNEKTDESLAALYNFYNVVPPAKPRQLMKPVKVIDTYEIDLIAEQENEQLNTVILNSIFKGKLTNKGAVYVEAGKKYNVNPLLLAAISYHETANGTKGYIKDRNNVAGITVPGNGLIFKHYQTIDESIYAFAELLRKYYISGGRNDIISIGKKFCPVGANNDPKGLNQYWHGGVTHAYEKIIKAKYGEDYKKLLIYPGGS